MMPNWRKLEMSENNHDPLTETPEDQPIDLLETQVESSEMEENPSGLAAFWNRVRQMGIAGTVTRIVTNVLTVVVVVAAVYGLGRFYINSSQPNTSAQNTPLPESDSTSSETYTDVEDIILPEYNFPQTASFSGGGAIAREAKPDTMIPSRSRSEVSFYDVQTGDSVFSIAEQFGLKPETILWGNYETLKDNPRFLSIGQVLNILPTDGIYYRYNAGESLTSIAKSFDVSVNDIIEYPGNYLDPYETNPEDPGIADGSWLIIPGGQRELQDWGPPAISRSNPAVAAYYGSGSCGEVYEGPIGDGVFIWPAVSTQISGYRFTPGIHEGIDIGGVEGSAVYASDTGVVVYSGWSEYGYGNMIVIDHGNGWQTAYAHLQYTSVGCGQAIYRGDTIGALGNTGNSTGPHLHFEMKSTIYGKVNPFDFIYGGG
jgi:murein DD-endopeptidase MepM/ murein hydrolase activator NlpD